MKFITSVLSIVMLIFISSISIANAASQDDWISGMSTALPVAFCKSDQYFRQCFNVTQVECEEMALSATRICLAKNKDKIPMLIDKSEGEKWGRIIGACAGEAYEVALQKERINNNKCNNIENWK